MTRMLPALLALVACGGEIGIGDRDDDVDPAVYDGATLRIVEPQSAGFIPYGSTADFVAELRDVDGELIETFDEVSWSSSADAAWGPTGLSFADDSIDVGRHELTASTELPNGDRVAHTIGGVLVQAEEAGTYVGTFAASMTFQSIPIACAGAAVLTVEPYGQGVSGTAECLASAAGFDIPLDFVVAAEHADGRVEGTASANIIAFEVEFPATGTLGGSAPTIELDFSGPVLTSEMTGSVSADRISRDAGL
jgi:hypothetical protein